MTPNGYYIVTTNQKGDKMMRKWWIFVGTEKREFWAKEGDDCYKAIRQECKKCCVGYQLAE